MAESKAQTSDNTGAGAQSQGATEKPPTEAPQDGVFDGNVRYEGSILVDREIDGQVVSVLTDKPRSGDKVQAKTFDEATGEFVQSKESTTKAGATRLPGKS